MLVVVRAAQGVGILNNDMPGDKGSDAAGQGTHEYPQQHRGPVLLEVQAVPGGVGRQAVAQAVVPVDIVEPAGNDRQQNQLDEPRGAPPVSGADRVDIPGQGVNEVPAVDAAGDEAEQDVGDEAPIRLQPVGGVAHGRRRGLVLGLSAVGRLLLGVLLTLGGPGVPLRSGVLGGGAGAPAEAAQGGLQLPLELRRALAGQGELPQHKAEDGEHAEDRDRRPGQGRQEGREGPGGAGEAIAEKYGEDHPRQGHGGRPRAAQGQEDEQAVRVLPGALGGDADKDHAHKEVEGHGQDADNKENEGREVEKEAKEIR